MKISPPSPSPRAEFVAGLVAVSPILVAYMPFAVILGASAVRHGLSGLEIQLMSLMVFAGSAQIMAVDIWQNPAPWLTLALTTLLINMRHILMGASLNTKVAGFPRWMRLPLAFILTDEAWATVERRALGQPLTPAYYFGAAIPLYLNWNLFTGIGAILGDFMPDPERFGFDFAFPAIFICLVAGFVRNWRAVPVILASALAAMIVHHLVAGTWYVIAGAAAGMAAAIALPAKDVRR